ncbi:MAG: dNTP triphosphohydrolase [Candidatus Eremiobacteraeota bacterium]|nr:dNTP triphosphohydrolase [Candidatus Eremiobacteraeota bacterium]
MSSERMSWRKLLSKKTLSLKSEDGQEESDFYRDIQSIVFSYAFRRMQNKTQLLPVPELDFVHTRLTHSLEAFCIGRELGREVGKVVVEIEKDKLKDFTPDSFANIVGAACLAHDIGNPAFGHSGEDAFRDFFKYNDSGKDIIENLNDYQKNDFLYFEGNAQGFRTLNKEDKILPKLTCATLASFIKYPRESRHIESENRKRKDQNKFGFFQTEKDLFIKLVKEVELIKLGRNDTLAYCRHPLAYLVEAADDISYKMFDIDDGFRLRLFNLDERINGTDESLKESLEKIIKAGGKIPDEKKEKLNDEKDILAYLRSKSIESLIKQIEKAFMDNYDKIMEGEFECDLMEKISSKKEVENLDKIAKEKIYKYFPVLEIEAAGFKTIGGLLEAFLKAVIKKDSRYSRKVKEMIPPEYDIDNGGDYKKAMKIVDYICGMSDDYAISLYKKIHGISLPRLY